MRQPINRWLGLQRRQRWLAVAAAGLLLVYTLTVFGVRWRQRMIDDRRPVGRVVAVAGPTALTVATVRGRIDAQLAGLHCPPNWAEASRRWLADHAGDRIVTLIRPRKRTGILTDAGWLVYTDSGLFLNERMVDQGYAVAADQPVHDLSPWFEQLADWARQAGRGQWTPSSP